MVHNPLTPILSFIRKNPFVMGLLGAMALAFIFPELGADNGPLKAGLVSKLGVMVIFFLQGLSLRTRELANGFRDIKLHGFIQSWIFLISPVFLVSAAFIMDRLGSAELCQGFLYLALIPTTISSAIALTSAGGGNVPAAIFNTSISNIFGVFWVPLGCLLLFSAGSDIQEGLLLQLLLKLAKMILLPLVAGQILRPVLQQKVWFQAISPRFKVLNHGIILFIVFAAFCDSRLSQTWNHIEPVMIIALLVVTALSVGLIHVAVWISSGWFFPEPEDRICAFFCGSQKTLAAGAPMALAIFSSDTSLQASLGVMLLPLLCYHPMQLLVAGIVLPRLSNPLRGL